MKTRKRLLSWWLILVFSTGSTAIPGKGVLAAHARQAAGTIDLLTMGTPYLQDFNTLAATGTMNNLGDRLSGWYLNESGGSSRDNELYAANTGSDNVADTYSYGASDSPERALGGLRSTSLITTFGAAFTNQTGSAITALEITYTGEEWRLGAAGRSDQLLFEYSTNATSLTDGTWIRVPGLDFMTPDIATTGAKDGNTAAKRRIRSATISTLIIPHRSTFWIRWSDADAAGYDDGLAVDDFSLVAFGLADLSIDNVASREGRRGTTTFTFSVSLASPAPPGGVTFDIATANDSAVAPGDYTVNSLSGRTIPAGSSAYTFDVPVHGDPIAETDETFFVDVTHVTGASVADGQGLGTIVNDDTTTTLTTSVSPSTVGSTVTFTATVNEPGAGTPTGSIEFFDGAIRLGTGVLNSGGQAMFSTSALATGSHTISAAYPGDPDFDGSATTSGITQVVEGPPTVSRITDGSGEAILENGYPRAALTRLQVVFSKDMNADTPADPEDALNVENYSLIRDDSTVIPIDPTITYAAQTATLSIHSGAALPNGRYTLTVRGALEDTLGAPIGADFVRVFFMDSGAPTLTRVATVSNDAALTNGSTLNLGFSSLEVTFNEEVSNPVGSSDPDDVTHPANYLLITPGPNGRFDTLRCTAGLTGDDVQIPTDPVTYNNRGGSGPFVATVQLNSGTALPNGTYRLYVCGTTSIVDLAGNALNNGADSQVTFTVLIATRRNPKTGFAPGVVTILPEQPADKAYADLGNLWIEIPNLKLKTDITGVPLTPDGWDVTWLNWQVGWLEGSAYPTWEGNTVLTAHGYTADGEAGPFALLRNLSYGETVAIHLGSMKYVYSVRSNLLVEPDDTRWLTKHETLDWVTLITCQQYDAKTKSYRYRRVVRAVLVRAEPE